jgi:N-succinyldiaminopimelate aminotransferase
MVRRRTNTSVFAKFGALAQRHDSINFAQGMPAFDAPSPLIEACATASRLGKNQYAPPDGVGVLRNAVARHADRFYRMEVDPESMVLITAGATAAIFSAIYSYIEAGDEVVTFDPSYECYRAAVEHAGGTLRTVPLHPPDHAHATWWFVRDELAAALGPSTRLLVINTPHNPTGKVFSSEELLEISEVVARHPALLVMVDECYEHLAYAPARHVRFARFPGMEQQTITIGSASKTFSVTGWRIGWLIAPPPVIKQVRGVHQSFIYSAPTPPQIAVASALDFDDAYFAALNIDYRRRLEALAETLESSGMSLLPVEGTFFAMLDVHKLGFSDDVEFCTHLTTQIGVTPLPCSAFFDRDNPDRGRYARFSFCRDYDAIRAAKERLGRFRAIS